ncbi:BMP-2-inducible protein kinase [Tritrichomonas musculus]|uniref:non-specific serine/threonine protein kinase n=1 Tax=Tritrichomonas musculus TaxID=1915356 RepID=A0ABR2GVW4_9EUKA
MSFTNRLSVGLTGTTLSINNMSITVGDKIADGGYGIIYRCTDSSGKAYALKALQAPDQEHYDAILQEYEIQKRCANHPNIVSVFGMTSNQATRQAIILMENCPDDLIKHINAVYHQGFDDKKIVEVFTQVCEAVNHMHSLSPPVIHRDLKPENVLRNNGIWKLCDFGSATTHVYKPKNESERNIASDDIQKNTTALYRAPEMCDLYRNQTIGTKVDVWALGCILYKLCTFKDAFAEGNNLQILNVKYQWPANKNVNQKFKDIVKYIFETDPDMRPSARDVLGELYRQFPDLVDPKWKQTKALSRNNSSSNNFQNNNSQDQNQLPRKNTPTTNFDIFSQGNPQSSPFTSPQPQQAQSANPFNNAQSNPFSQSAPKSTNPFSGNSTVPPPNPFDNTPQASSNPFDNPPQESSNPFDKPPQQSSNPFNNSQPQTNPFHNPPQQSTNPFNNSQPQSNPFHTKSQSDGNTYDPFAALPSSQNTSQTPSNDPFNSQGSAPISNDPFAQGPAPTFTPPSGNGSYDPFELAVQQAKQQGKVTAAEDSTLVDVSQESPAQIPLSAKSSSEIEDYSVVGEFSPKLIEHDAIGFMKKCIKLDEIQLTSVLYSVNASYPSTLFFFQFLHACGTNVDKVALCLPENIPPPMGPVILSRKSFHKHFPQFEGNFALTSFLKKNKESQTPAKVGDPPICVDAVKELLSHLDTVITLLRAVPKKEIADEAFFCYQVTAYLLARLKAFSIKEGYTVETAIPMFKNFHSQFKKAFTLVKEQINFPQEPFDFNDETFLKRIRPPTSKTL